MENAAATGYYNWLYVIS